MDRLVSLRLGGWWPVGAKPACRMPAGLGPAWVCLGVTPSLGEAGAGSGKEPRLRRRPQAAKAAAAGLATCVRGSGPHSFYGDSG
jgi:hypothetical protein